MNKKIKIIAADSNEMMEEKVNKFCEDNKVIQIKPLVAYGKLINVIIYED